MASGVGKHKLLSLGPTEPWSVREKLCLASSVMKSGDQNWVSVSRAIKPFAEPGRPPDWFSQKHCASQYSELLETTETPKRKRGEKGEVVETVEDVIVRKLTAERIEELKRLIKDTQEKHRKLKRESELIQAGHLDSKLEELWGSIVQKKKQEEEEAELKRKTTDAAYQARLAVKNTPKRAPSVTVRSPLGASSPSLDFSLIETTQPIPEDPSTTPGCTAPGAPVFMPLPETPGPGSSEAGLGSLLDDSPQKKILGQKATPPPSPLLSELLKKGSLLPTSPRLVGEGDVTAGHMTGPHGTELQVSVPTIPASQAATGAPTLSRLLEAGPTQFPSPLGSLATTETPAAVVPPTLDTSASLSTGPSLSASFSLGFGSSDSACCLSGAGADMAESTVPRACTLPGDGKAGELADEDLVTVSYMGDELDLETVGDIIAIIEEKVDDNAEALDAAAVEAALSLCEEVADGHTLPNPWEPGPFKPPDPNPVASTVSACPAVDPSLELKKELLEDKVIVGSPASFTLASGPQGSNIPHPHLSPVPPSYPGSDGEEGSISELKECGEGDVGEECTADGEGPEAYLSEAELEPAASESEDGYSLHTASSLQLHNTADSIPSSPASSQLGKCIIKSNLYANVFLQPVTDDIAPGYHSIVHRPMDLSTIKKNIETGLIRTTAEFQRDIMLMFQNAVMYNSSDHDVYHMALEMQRDVLEQIQQFLATQLIMQTSESGISAKSLRGRDSTRKQDSSDKDGGTRGRRCAIEADLKMKK
uniref:Bromodomain containing 8 n=1 Tax=Scleropages formosus TaxID=113540 RepID=A0A8C9WLB1_SCLFO